MDALVARVGSFVARERLLGQHQQVLALASGGADSTLLVHALVRLGYEVSVLHVAHALRGPESEADAVGVAALADELGVPFTRADAPLADGPDLERRARDLRRAAADAIADGRSIATGHTRDDRLETILYRLASSPGAAAFRALPPSDGAGRVRPLLELGRDEVRECLTASGISWRDDASNDDRRFARVRARLDLLPAFRSLHPAADQNLLRTSAQLVEQSAVLDDAAGALLIEDGAALDAHAAAAAPPALARAALRRLAGPPSPPAACLQRALELCHRRAGTRRVPLGAGRIAERRYGIVRVTADAPALAPPDSAPLCISGRTPFGSLAVSCRPVAEGLDPALAAGAHVRAARPGEHLDGRRPTIARMLLEARVPQPLRSVYPVIEVDGRLVCVPGVAVAAHVSARPGLELAVESA
ncbi:MAG: tRNA(Ile)-lysidine synthase [Gaiellales bacterium]|nr:tRNA(Ile)-lysidine synthase [Gaiellales bacterium]